MKIFKRILTLTVIVLFSITIVGCNGNNGGKKPPLEKNEEGYYEGEIEITIVDLGYGKEWLERIIDEYEALYPGAVINLETSRSADGTKAILKSEANTSDIIVSTGALAFEEKNGFLVDMSEVLTAIPEGETLTVGEKMNPTFKEHFQNDKGEIYQFPWQNGYSGIAYNQTSLDGLFGEGNWELPKTTDELVEFAKTIKGAGAYPFSMTTSQSYWENISYVWWAQYEGLEAYNNFWYGKYEKNGEIVTVSNADSMREMLAQKGRLRMYEVLKEIILPANGYVHKNSDSMSYSESQLAFLGVGYGPDKKKAPMLVIGDWIFNEMKSQIQRPEVDGDIRFMAAPVISSIVEKLEDTNMSEETLRLVVEAIDNDETNYPGVSENDFNRIKEARHMSYVHGQTHVISMPRIKSGGINKELSFQFLTFLFGNYAQEIFIQNNQGLAMPYGFDVSTVPNLSEYAKSVNSLTNHPDFIAITRNYLSPLVYGAGFMPLQGYAESLMFTEGISPEKIVHNLDSAILSNLKQLLPLIKE